MSALPETIETTRFMPDGTNTRLLRDAFGQYATGVTIVTVASKVQ